MSQNQTPPLVFALSVNVDSVREEEFNRWYDTDHLPAVLACPGVISGQRYTAERVGAGPQDIATYWAFYEVESAEAMHSPEITVLAESGFGPFADCVSHVRRYWFRPMPGTVGTTSGIPVNDGSGAER